MCQQASDTKFVSLGQPGRIWAISAIHGEAERLVTLHDRLIEHIRPGDRVIYHGNYIGYGEQPVETIDELVTFRRLALSIPGMKPTDIVYLRGGQEEMWEKLQQLQFANNPADILLWMLGKGLSSTLASYGICPHDGIIAAQEGVMSLTKWTAKIRQSVKRRPGHYEFASHLRRAAYTETGGPCPMLFVHAGIDPARPLDDQGDNFWWSSTNFNAINLPFSPFQKVIRGFDPRHEGLRINCVTATIDGGCGFGGPMVCAGFGPEGDLLDLLEV